MEVLHGTYNDVFGRPAKSGGYTFMPADVELAGSASSLDCYLSDHCGAHAPQVLQNAVDEQFDAAWVRARIPNVFGFTPHLAEVEKSLLDVGFVAVAEEALVCYPFICSDHYGRSALMFSDEGPDGDVKRSIAAAFWDVLMQNPDDLSDFAERVYHPGAGVWLNYRCRSGEICCEETAE